MSPRWIALLTMTFGLACGPATTPKAEDPKTPPAVDAGVAPADAGATPAKTENKKPGTTTRTGALAIPNKRAKRRPPHIIGPRPLPPPVLMVRRNNRSVPLELRAVKINATIVGHLAQTEMTMSFYNPNSRVMEGDLYFPLPQGSTVSGYALDVGGVMVDRVVVDKDRARQVFEAEVRK